MGTPRVSEPGRRIDKLYVHDDGVGPFAVMPIEAAPAGVVTQTGVEPPVMLRTDWSLLTPVAGRTTCNFMPEWIIVPAYSKIRVSYFALHSWISRLANMFFTNGVAFATKNIDVAAITWDVRLTLVNAFKSELRARFWENSEARHLSQVPLPRFMWVATMLVGNAASWMLLFDATDTQRACPLMRTLWLDSTHRGILDGILQDAAFEAKWRTPLTPHMYDTLKVGHASYLDP